MKQLGTLTVMLLLTMLGVEANAQTNVFWSGGTGSMQFDSIVAHEKCYTDSIVVRLTAINHTTGSIRVYLGSSDPSLDLIDSVDISSNVFVPTAHADVVIKIKPDGNSIDEYKKLIITGVMGIGGANPTVGNIDTFTINCIDKTNNLPNNAPTASYGDYEYAFDFSTYNNSNGEVMQTIAYRGLNDTIELVACLNGNCDELYVGNNVSNTMAVENLIKLSINWGTANIGTETVNARKVKVTDPTKLASFTLSSGGYGAFAGDLTGSCNALPDTVVVQNGGLGTVSQALGGEPLFNTARAVNGVDTTNSNIDMNPVPPSYTFSNYEKAWKKCAVCHSIVNINTLLPVLYKEWTANAVHGDVLLKWTTADEIGNGHFEIEHSTDGIDWKTIGTVMSQSDGTSQDLSYEFTHQDPNNPGRNYYRLKQVDIDRRVSYNNVLVVTLDGQSTISAYPLPTSDILHVDISTNKISVETIKILDMTGQVLHSEQLTTQQGANKKEISLGHLPSGLYFLKVGSKILKIMKR